MRLVLTRPVEDAKRTRAKLEALGHQVLVSPVIEIVGTGASWPDGVVDGLLATSAQAFGVDLHGPPQETRRVMPLYLVGSRTIDAAREAGFLGAATVAQNADLLASALAAGSHRLRRMVYLAGRDRKPNIEGTLVDRGWAFDVVEVYEARPVEKPVPELVKAFGHNAVHGVLHFSRRSAGLFIDMAKKAGLDMGRPKHYCLSEDVAAPLRDAGIANIAIATSPRESDLLALVGPA